MHIFVKFLSIICTVGHSALPLQILCGVYNRLGGTKPLEEGVLLQYQAHALTFTLVFLPLFQEGCPRSLFMHLLSCIHYKGLVIVTSTV
jgi:hypothetical protein